MPTLPNAINGVAVEFAPTVVTDVEQSVIDGLQHCIRADIAARHRLTKIYISSAADSHTAPSRHVQRKAVDISRINGVKIAVGYPSNPVVKAIVDAIQTTFESFPKRRENFGPHLKRKSGQAWTVGGHHDHIHLSVN